MPLRVARRPRSAVVMGSHHRRHPRDQQQQQNQQSSATTTPHCRPRTAVVRPPQHEQSRGYMRPTQSATGRRTTTTTRVSSATVPSSSSSSPGDGGGNNSSHDAVIAALKKNHSIVQHVFSIIRHHCESHGRVVHAFDRFRSRVAGWLTHSEMTECMRRVLDLELSSDECSLVMMTLAGSSDNQSTVNMAHIGELSEAVRLSRTPALFSQFLIGRRVLKYGDPRALDVPSMFRVTALLQPTISPQARDFMRERKEACVIRPPKRRQNNHLRSDSRLLGSHPDECVDDGVTERRHRRLHANRLGRIRQQRVRLDAYAQGRQHAVDSADEHALHSHRAQYTDWMRRINGAQHDQGWIILHSDKPLVYKYRHDPSNPLATPHW